MQKKYELTPEHRERLKPWADKWIANAISTKSIDDADRAAMRIAVKGLYESAGLTPPPEHRIVFVPSPAVLRFAGGFAAAIWWLRKNPNSKLAIHAATHAATYDATHAATAAATYDATRDATAAATHAATDAATRDATAAATHAATAAATHAATADATDAATAAATYDATDAATRAATDAATRAATEDATYAATEDATRDATAAATADATYDATYDATAVATAAATYDAIDKTKWFVLDINGMRKVAAAFGILELGLRCAQNAYNMWQGGNQWSAWVGFLSFFRHVAKLGIDYSKWQHWESAAVHGGPRIMHPDFCMISDRPKTLTVDEQNRPHNFDGPFCEWRDGFALYSIHGVRIPAWIAETKREDFTKEMILSEQNADNRRCIIQKIGIEKAIELLGAETIDTYDSPVGGKYELLSIDYDGRGERRPYLKMRSKSIEAFHIEGVAPGTKTVKEAIMYRNGLPEFCEPLALT